MPVIAKTKKRIYRHLAAAGDAIDRAKDGLDVPDHVFETDDYVQRQLLIAVEALHMAAARMKDHQAEAEDSPSVENFVEE